MTFPQSLSYSSRMPQPMPDTAKFVQPDLAQLKAAAQIVYGSLAPTPQYCWPLLSQRADCEVWVKHENHLPTGAFKVRGGLVYMARLKSQNPEITGIVTSTRGNHGQSIAFAARAQGLTSVVVVPQGNAVEKNAAMRALGAELIIHGRDYQEAREFSAELAADRGLPLIGPFEQDLVDGVATYALELFRAHPDLETVYVPIGMGSGICGMIAARDALKLKTHIVGVVSSQAPSYALSFEAGEVRQTETADTMADGIACRSPLASAVEVINRGAQRIIQVTDEAIEEAIGHIFTDTHNVAEGAGAAGLAALLTDRPDRDNGKSAIVLTGGNIDRAVFTRILAAD